MVIMSFKKLKLSKEILKALDELGYKEPTGIQKEAIDILLRKRDLLAIAKTGTGKTAAFVLPMLQDIQKDDYKKDKLTKLIIAPTKELVRQLECSINNYSKYLNIKTISIYGGANINVQIKLLNQKPNIVVSTTGRLLDLIDQKNINLTKIDTLVLDEADTMLDMGFFADIKKLFENLPNLKQMVLSSATLTSNIKRLSNEILKNPKVIEVKSKDRVNEKLEQISYPTPVSKKLQMLSFLIGSQNISKSLVFCKTKALANDIAKNLNLDGLKADAIHGDKTVGRRKKIIEQFKDGKIRVLVATDIAARGLDIEDLPVVINFDLPFLIVDYLHRVGRTARAGKDGLAISLIDEYDMALLREIERYLSIKIPRLELDGFKVDKKIYSIAKKKIIATKEDNRFKKVNGAFGKKKQKKELKKQPKVRGKRIIVQKKF
jgi:ATP-dependent RNA helicase RhlE